MVKLQSPHYLCYGSVFSPKLVGECMAPFSLASYKKRKVLQFPVMGEKVKLQAKVEAPAEHELKLYD